MASVIISAREVSEFKPSLVLLLWDGFTGSNELVGDVIVRIGSTDPLFVNAPAEFVFGNLPDGSYTVKVESASGEPFYLPVDIPVTLPFPRPADIMWDPIPVWQGYPDIALADSSKMLSDSGQTPAYLGQRALATLSPTTAYPFPVGTTLVRGLVTGAGAALSGALVTTGPVAQPGQFAVAVVTPAGVVSAPRSLMIVQAPVIDTIDPPVVIASAASFTLVAQGSGFLPGAVLQWNGASLRTTFLGSGGLAAQVSAELVTAIAQVTVVAVNSDGNTSGPQKLIVAAALQPLLPSILQVSLRAARHSRSR